MKNPFWTSFIGGLFVAGLAAAPQTAHAGKGMSGYQEVPPVSTLGTGTCKVKAASDGTSIAVELSYADTEGIVSQAHVHFGQLGVSGAISFFICTNLGNGPVGTPACPASPSTVTRTIVAADITALAASQGIGAGQLPEVIRAIKAKAAYCDVHSDTWPSGELRQQLK